MIAPLQSPPAAVATFGIGTAALTKPPLVPAATVAGTLEANLASKASTPSRAWAQAALQTSRKWTEQFTYFANAMGVDLGRSLQFARRDELFVRSALVHAPDRQLDRATNRLVQDWTASAPQIFQQFRHGLYQKAGTSLAQVAASLAVSGVTSPQIQKAFQDAGTLLQQLETAGIPSAGGLDQGKLQAAISRIKIGISDAMSRHAQQHPDQVPALQGAWVATVNALDQLTQGMSLMQAKVTELGRDLVRLREMQPAQPRPPSP